MNHRHMILAASVLLLSTATAQWEPDQRLTEDTAGTYTAAPNNHPVCLSGDTLYIAFTDSRDGKFNVYFIRSFNAGTSWENPVQLSSDTTNILWPSLAASGALVHVAWPTYLNTAIMYRRSTDAGATWTAAETLVASSRGCGDPSLAAEGNTVGMVWSDSRDGNWNGELYYKQSNNGGLTWTSDMRLTSNAQDSILDKEACLAAAGNYRHIVWTQVDWNTSSQQAWYMRSADGGANWQQPTRLTADTTQQNQPVVAAAGANVHVCWWDGRDEGYGIWYRGSADNGATWRPEHYLTGPNYGSDYPTVAAAGGNVHVSFRKWPGGQFQFGYCGSTDNGHTWSAETTLTTAAGMGTSAIAASGACAHLVFYDNRDGNSELYYKRNLTAGGLQEAMNYERGTTNVRSTIIHDMLRMSGCHSVSAEKAGRCAQLALLNATGRRAVDLHSGLNDVRQLAPGVYFLREPRTGAAVKLVKIR